MKVEEVGLDGVPLMAPSDREICEETPTILQNLENTNAKRIVLIPQMLMKLFGRGV